MQFFRVPRKGGAASRGFCDHEAMKTMKIHRLHRFAFPVPFIYLEPRKTLPDIQRVSLAPPQRISCEVVT